MRNNRWLRFSFASLAVIAASACSLAACSDDEDDNNPTPNNDAGNDTGTSDSGGGNDGGSDSGQDGGDAAPTFELAKLTVVNAATDFGPASTVPGGSGFQAIRICFAVGPSEAASGVSPVPPQPETGPTGLTVPGLYFGTGGKLPSFGLDLQNLVVVPYVMNAKILADKGLVKPGPGMTGVTCDEILKAGFTYDGGGTLTAGVDYWKLPVIPAQTFLHDKSYAIVITGCAGDADINPNNKCGANFTSGAPGNGSLAVTVHELARPTVPAAEVATQFVHASSAAATFFGATSIPVQPAYVTDPATAGGARPVTSLTGTDSVPFPGPITAPVNVANVNFAAGGDSFTVFASAATASLAIPLSNIETLSGFPAGTYKAGEAYTFFLVGDPDPAVPTMVGTAFNLRKYHFLALPNDPVIEAYKP